MKKLNLFWKILIVLVAIVLLVCIYAKVKRTYLQHYEYYECCSYSDHCEVVKYWNEDIRVRLKASRKYTTPRLSWIAHPLEGDSLTVFAIKGKRGYVNLNTGKISIQAKYQRAWQFSEGLGAVSMNNRIGFINAKGETVIECVFPYKPGKDVEMDFVFKKGMCAVKDSTGKTGIINKQGQWILPPTYSCIYLPVKNYRVVVDGKYFGVIDSAFNAVIPVKYDRVKVRKDGFLLASNYTQQLVDFDCKTVLIPFIYDDSNILFYNTEYDSSGDHDMFTRTNFTEFEINGKKGLLSPQGKVIVPAMYDDISALGPCLFTCQTGDEWLTVNGEGERIK